MLKNHNHSLLILLSFYVFGRAYFYFSIADGLFLLIGLKINTSFQIFLALIIVVNSLLTFGNFEALAKFFNKKYFQYFLFVILFLTNFEYCCIGFLTKRKSLRISIIQNYFIFGLAMLVVSPLGGFLVGCLVAYVVIMFFSVLVDVVLIQKSPVIINETNMMFDCKFISATFINLLEYLFVDLSISPIQCHLGQLFAEKEFATLGLVVHHFSKSEK